MVKRPLVLKTGKLHELPLGDQIPWGVINSSSKFYHLADILAAFDLVASVTYADAGLRSQRISSVTYQSTAYPNADMTKDVFWLDAGTMNQRIEKIEWTGSVFSPDSLRKVFNYSTSGISYNLDGFEFEIF